MVCFLYYGLPISFSLSPNHAQPPQLRLVLLRHGKHQRGSTARLEILDPAIRQDCCVTVLCRQQDTSADTDSASGAVGPARQGLQTAAMLPLAVSGGRDAAVT